LDSMAGLVKHGARIVYSTCSLEPEENEELINAWLKVHSRFRLERSYLSWPPNSGQDGAYAALLKSL
ncbi:MAG: 16S rRNA (cytosine(967)-C(5))-methyltransferase RsmB, partial [Lentisphaerae bacterium]|nr:16S rRNA (cytosine(967)-C(5))-methyltransferase RsmB [Lentisphaerota bacterium]